MNLPLSSIDIVGYWIAIFLTICILSYLYSDNPFYKFAEHLFIGVSLGFVIIQQYHDNLHHKLVLPVAAALGWGEAASSSGDYTPWFSSPLWKLVPLLLVVMMFTKALSRKLSWVGRYPLAFVVGLYGGLQINALVQADLGRQITAASRDLDSSKTDLNSAGPSALAVLPGMSPELAQKLVTEREQKPFASVSDAVTRPSLEPAERELLRKERGNLVGLDAVAGTSKGERNWFGVLSNVLLLLGTLATILYFYYSFAHKGVVGGASRFGVWVLMIGFGASFGFTVQGRIALAYGRARDLLGESFVVPADAAAVNAPWVSIISVAIIAAGIAYWEIWRRKQDKS